MFDSFQAAHLFADSMTEKGFIYTLMELSSTGNGEYSWELKEGGVASQYRLLNFLYSARWAFAALTFIWIVKPRSLR